MKKYVLATVLLSVALIIAATTESTVQAAQLLLPPPTPIFTLTVPRINKITYKVEITNLGNLPSTARVDIALPKTWSPDTYIEINGITTTQGTVQEYSDRENSYVYATFDLGPTELFVMNVTFYSLKYRFEYNTYNGLKHMSYPNELAIYAQPETYIESNDIRIANLAAVLVGDLKNPFRIAEKMYDYVIAELRYQEQSEIRGALWALLEGKGDCSEYGTLFVALMRAIGIPARTVTGHMSSVLSRGGTANATSLWVDSPHLWAEFYVDGYGWIPVDPTSGEGDPLDHFSILQTQYLPFLKGPTMDAPLRSLLTIRSDNLQNWDYDAVLFVEPLTSIPFTNQAIISMYNANDLVNAIRRAAYNAYNPSAYDGNDYGFNITAMYPLLQESYDAFYNATEAMRVDDYQSAGTYAMAASQKAGQVLDTIFSIVLNEARTATNDAWREFRILGALSGENYLRKAAEYKSVNDYFSLIKYSYYAKTGANEAPSILIFVGPVILCALAIWMIEREFSKPKKEARSGVRIKSTELTN